MSAIPAAAGLGPLAPWFGRVARDLPWRRAEAGAWAVLVSEVMLQQTPVVRVLPAYEAWLRRWPTPAALAADPAGEAVRQWGRLGYPRRALRLHAAATAITQRHNGAVPTDLEALLALPGVGTYTARAVAAFAHGQRHAVVDTNVRRVVARWALGRAGAETLPLPTVEALLPDEPRAAVLTSAALMELGALVCTSRSPRCPACPLEPTCAWRAAGSPAGDAPVRRQLYEGTDRQARGRLLAVLRERTDPVQPDELLAACPEGAQRQRALAGLLADGLALQLPDGRLALPD